MWTIYNYKTVHIQKNFFVLVYSLFQEVGRSSPPFNVSYTLWLASRSYSVKREGEWRLTLAGKSGKHHLCQVIRPGVISIVVWIARVLVVRCCRGALTSIIIPQTHKHSLTMRKTPHKPQFRDSLWNIWPVLFKTAKVIKSKKSLRNYHISQIRGT